MNDILLDDINDLKIENGDIVCGYSDVQHQELLLAISKGELKEKPTVGVGIMEFLKDENIEGMLAEVKQEFERDGMEVNNIRYANDKLVIDAHY